ncbi:MAG: HAD-IB family phosphatase [Candidatus Marinimicrobia bacterium]|jgi:D-3-phosphoglycerate dehydrogenase|nr:HAD-IB family phosphatase [Candidatus Neomarinimicrobiota bacterium]MBT5338830.1 HAD-IB family phosphatase [Candidatus Neomarinimicrobiota bacterium]MBT6196199.1 HAD-IB family phosphatase [Candidatus Neomarinimicrobiota bacterium]MBT7871613.1 HAD-IB family phosphatase [Candidatus Neomarinimicrobiota bacterium]MBT7986276.1 HAD-IB family phosphatase [Candidatus Neomarinimicrobiota bacterium]
MKAQFLILDFDNTIIRGETMDELARISLSQSTKKAQIISEIESITASGMSGEMPFDESLTKRIQLLKANKSHVNQLISSLRERIDDSIIKHFEFFNHHKEKIFIISGGFKTVIEQVLEKMPFIKNHIFGNEFIFDQAGWVTGTNKNNLLSKHNGKSKLLASLKLNGNILVVGDGYSDAEMKISGQANLFFAYTGNVKRNAVLPHADLTVISFDEVINSLEMCE